VLLALQGQLVLLALKAFQELKDRSDQQVQLALKA
jgi:hypothetical protein